MSAPTQTRSDVIAGTVRPRGLLIGGLIALAVFAAFAIHVAFDLEHPSTQPLDDAWRRLVGSDHGPETGILPMFFQELGQVLGAIIFGLIIPIALFATRRWRSALFILAGFFGSSLVSQLVKNLVHRPRPAEDLDNGLFGPLFSVDHGSLPSGHSVTVGFIVIGVAALIPPARRWIWWIFATFLAVGMVWQRTLINAHWLSDTIVGLVAGAGVAAILWWAFYPLLAMDAGRTVRRTKPAVVTEGTEGATL